ncbi:hypothetical protein CN918_28650 [Priestia megaterium]|nr:hypothetical protein CN918_28650 [Priestia megaterium]
MTNLDLTKVNITSEEDWMMLKEEWTYYFDNQHDFAPYRKLLSRLNIIVGFGRGFWASVDDYFYLTYHQDKGQYYWYVRNIEKDDEVYFYKVANNAPILDLLTKKAIEDNFREYDEILDYSLLYTMSNGEVDKLPAHISPVELADVFGEDSLQLRMALMNFGPGSQGSMYPHLEFHHRFFKSALGQTMDKMIDKYNSGTFKVFREGECLFVQLNDDVFELTKK